MKRLEALVQLLLAINSHTFKPDKDLFNNHLNRMRKQGLLIDKIKDLAKQEGTLLGRIISFPAFPEGKCYYVITQIYARTVQIDWLNYCDGWSDARCGHQAILDKNYAQKIVNLKDHWDDTIKPQIICPTITASSERLKEYIS